MSMPESATSGRDNHDQRKDSTGARLYSIIVRYVVYLGEEWFIQAMSST